MTDALIALVPHYGLWLIGLTTLASCMALPVPASMMMLTAGGFAASGDLIISEVIAVALIGAIFGDMTGYTIGRSGSGRVAKMKGPAERARRIINQHGAIGVFFTRWMLSALGPYVNLFSGAAGMHWARFVIPAILGECVWVGLYVGLGYTFAGQIVELAQILANAAGFLAALAVTVILGWLLLHFAQRPSQSTDKPLD